jgi:hypothetical protein
LALKGFRVHQNNLVYKGFRLNARVSREFPGGSSDDGTAPQFTATVLVTRANMIQSFGEDYVVPKFAQGNRVDSPRDAVHVAVSHGCDIVDALTDGVVAPSAK